MLSIAIYDIEIENAIPSKGQPKIDGIMYAEGFHDHANLGISCIGAWDYLEERPRIFCEDNKDEFEGLIQNREIVVTFNGLNFDNRVIEAAWQAEFGVETKHYDILQELWKFDGLNPWEFNPRTHGGYGLDRCVEVNFGLGKTGNGALAPVWYQRGQIGKLHDYCLADIWLTKKLFDKIIADEQLVHPKTGTHIVLPNPLRETR